MSPGLLSSTFLVLRKDLLIEWRTRARLNALLFFAFATLLLFSFAMDADTRALQKGAGGFLWLSVLFASVLCLGESFRVESENAALDGLRLIPTDARAIFLGKALGNALLIFAICLVVLPVMIALFDVHVSMSLGRLLGILALGCLAISAPGTVHAAIASHARARDVLLPLLLFPLLIPALLCAVKATTLVFQGDPMNQCDSWMGVLSAFNLIYWGLGFALFPLVVEE